MDQLIQMTEGDEQTIPVCSIPRYVLAYLFREAGLRRFVPPIISAIVGLYLN